MVRGFYVDGRLHFDDKGAVLGKVHQGAWTLSGIAIEKVKVSDNKIELEGPRLAQLYDPKQQRFVAVRTDQNAHIVVDRDASQPNTAVMNSIEHIFASEGDRLVDLVPDYWKPWISGAFEVVPQEGLPDCHRFKGRAQRTGDGGIVIPCEEHAKAKTVGQKTSFDFDTSFLPYQVGKGVTPPKTTFAPDPSMSSFARFVWG